MTPKSEEELREIAKLRDVRYEAIPDSDPLVVRTQMSKVFGIGQDDLFTSFADPMAHVPLFSIIKSSTPPIRYGIQGVLPENQFFVFEHVEEGGLPPRIMLVRYTLKRPTLITKEAVTNPFIDDDGDTKAPEKTPPTRKPEDPKGPIKPLDKKKGVVHLRFTKVAGNRTRLTTASMFHAETGAIFARRFIDAVWLNFYERMMVVNGTLKESEMRTGPMR